MKTTQLTKEQLKKELDRYSLAINSSKKELSDRKKEIKALEKDADLKKKLIEENDKEVKSSNARVKAAKQRCTEEETRCADLIVKSADTINKEKEGQANISKLNKDIKGLETKLQKTKESNAEAALKGAEMLLGICGQLEKSANILKQTS